MMRCAISENKDMILHRLHKCLNDDFRKEVRLYVTYKESIDNIKTLLGLLLGLNLEIIILY
jgi:hypothetical protein